MSKTSKKIISNSSHSFTFLLQKINDLIKKIQFRLHKYINNLLLSTEQREITQTPNCCDLVGVSRFSKEVGELPSSSSSFLLTVFLPFIANLLIILSVSLTSKCFYTASVYFFLDILHPCDLITLYMIAGALKYFLGILPSPHPKNSWYNTKDFSIIFLVS